VFCVYDSGYHFVAEVLDKIDSKGLARAIWGINTETQNTWQFMYFLNKPKVVDVPLKEVDQWLNSRYMGFFRIGDEKVENIITQFGSLEKFIMQKFTTPTTPATHDPVQEFLAIMRRYQQEKIVFQSAVQGQRYAVTSVDEGVCDIQRLDAEENVRFTTDLLLEKINMVKGKGGIAPFDTNFEGTVAKKMTMLQAGVFALEPDKRIIVFIDDESKALDLFCEILKELHVDESSGKPSLYKPAMIACVIEGVASGELKENKIPFDWLAPKFIAKMASLGQEVGAGEAVMPFFHLTGDLFWMLSYKDLNQLVDGGHEGPKAIRDKVAYATIKDTFWPLLQSPQNREKLMKTLSDQWWPQATSADLPQCWWVCQGHSYNIEKAGGYIWAPKKQNQLGQLFHHANVSKVKTGDIVFSYVSKAIRAVSTATSDGASADRPEKMEGWTWAKEGWRANLNYFELKPPIDIGAVRPKIAKLGHKYGPVDTNGGTNQGYLFELQPDAVRILLEHIDLEALPEAIRNQLRKFLNLQTRGSIMNKLVNQIYERIAANGMVFLREDIENFFCCLRAKPFVLLAGISGTGKSKLVRLFAEAVGATTENHRFKLIPVRPDWNDNSDLIGYFDLEGKFQPGALVSTLIRAQADPQQPFFLCLDEMNLARVEHYFSDFLSVIESRRWKTSPDGSRVQTDPILTATQLASLQQATLDEDVKAALPALLAANPHGLSFPDNLYVVGTVNMDETTHPFSRKVLDRANAVEFSDIRLTDGIELDTTKVNAESVSLANDQLRGEFIAMPDLVKVNLPLAKETAKRLTEINEILKRGGFEIGYRVRDEAAFYRHYAAQVGINQDRAWEHVVLQKILPRIQGSSDLVKQALVELLDEFGGKTDPSGDHFRAELKNLSETGSPIQRKLAQMLIRYEMDGFTSYWAS
jgi:energy-coupling factor transporter ATP-binding protein EcfA2